MSTEGSEPELALEDTIFYDFLNIKVIHCQLLIVVGCGISAFKVINHTGPLLLLGKSQ